MYIFPMTYCEYSAESDAVFAYSVWNIAGERKG